MSSPQSKARVVGLARALNDATVTAGETATFECELSYEGIAVEWFLAGAKVEPGDRVSPQSIHFLTHLLACRPSWGSRPGARGHNVQVLGPCGSGPSAYKGLCCRSGISAEHSIPGLRARRPEAFLPRKRFLGYFYRRRGPRLRGGNRRRVTAPLVSPFPPEAARQNEPDDQTQRCEVESL